MSGRIFSGLQVAGARLQGQQDLPLFCRKGKEDLYMLAGLLSGKDSACYSAELNPKGRKLQMRRRTV